MIAKTKRVRLNAPQPTALVVHPTAIYNRKDAARFLRTSEVRITQLIKDRLLAGRKEGHHYLILGESILTYLRSPKPSPELTQSASPGIDAA